MTVICINAAEYHAEVDLEGLPTLPVNNIRKFLTLAFSDPWKNRKAIQTVTDWLPGAVSDAKNAYGYSITLYKEGYRTVKKGSRKSYDVEQRKKNRSLIDSVKSAKAAYDQIIKFQSIFNEIKEKKNYA